MMLLAVDKLSVAYGDLFAVREVSFTVDEGTVFVLLGANGAGKTSILRSISGLIPARGGRVEAEGKSVVGLAPHQVARVGISHVPEGRRIFPHLTVEENLIVSFLSARASVSAGQALAAVFELFPRLAERRRQAGGTLSGGEQQMLAIGRSACRRFWLNLYSSVWPKFSGKGPPFCWSSRTQLASSWQRAESSLRTDTSCWRATDTCCRTRISCGVPIWAYEP
jgi:ABC-type branched-subunit amino acid transport system ATPase component